MTEGEFCKCSKGQKGRMVWSHIVIAYICSNCLGYWRP